MPRSPRIRTGTGRPGTDRVVPHGKGKGPEAREIADRLTHLATATIDPDADVQVIENVTGDIGTVRDTVVDALASGPPPTGRTGSGSLRDVDKIVVALNPGPAATNHGMIAAGVHWSLTAACPLIVAELTRLPDGHSRLTNGEPVWARLGADHVLAGLAVSAVKRLDLRTACHLVARGSHVLRRVWREVRGLQLGLYGPAPNTCSDKERLALARQRLTVIAHVSATRPLPAAYLAVEVLRPAVFPWHAWTRACQRVPALRELTSLAARSLQGHAFDRRTTYGRVKGPAGASAVPGLLGQAVRQMEPRSDDDELLKTYKSVIESLEGIYRETG